MPEVSSPCYLGVFLNWSDRDLLYLLLATAAALILIMLFRLRRKRAALHETIPTSEEQALHREPLPPAIQAPPLEGREPAQPTAPPVAPVSQPVALESHEKLPPVQPVKAVPFPTPEPARAKTGLEKSRRNFFQRVRSLFQAGPSENLTKKLEELLITSDLGLQTSQLLIARTTERLREQGSVDEETFLSLCRDEVLQILKSERPAEIILGNTRPYVVAIVGVNGVGKTTTIGKLANQFASRGNKVLVAACDTFRAGAVNQLGIWAQRAGVSILSGDEGEKPSTVAYRAVHKAKDEQFDLLLVDTAGRLHTRVNLMNELGAILELMKRELGREVDECILVVDATTGQNALQQAREFNQKGSLSGVIVTKLDGTPKGGIVVAIKRELNIPVRYIGVGEGIEDLQPFEPAEFVEGLFAKDQQSEPDPQPDSSNTVVEFAAAGAERTTARRRRRE